MTQGQARARWIALALATAAALYLCWAMLAPFIDILIWATVLVIVFFPLHKRIFRRLQRPSISALVSVLVVMLLVIVPLTLISSAVLVELAAMRQGVQDRLQGLIRPTSGNTPLDRLLESVGQYIDLQSQVSEDSIKQLVNRASEVVVRGTVSFVGGAVQFVVRVFFILFVMYYLFRDGETIADRIPGILPLKRPQAEAMMCRATGMIHASVYGIVVIAVLQGTLGGVMFWILGVPSALVWGVVMTVLSTIPLVGSYFVWIPAAIWLASSGHWAKATVLVCFGLLVIGTIDNLLRPRLVGRKTRLHDLVIFFSLLGGIKVFGFLGILLGPVVIAITLALLQVTLEGIEEASS